MTLSLPDWLPHPFSPAGRRDPYPAYSWLRRHSPVYRDASSGLWLVTSYAGCMAVLRDERLSAALGQEQRTRADKLPPSILNTDGDEHRRLRAPAQLLLGPRPVAGITAGLSENIEAIFTALTAGAEVVDATEDIGTPIATAAFARLLGLESADIPVFTSLAARVSVNLDPLAGQAAAADGREAARWFSSWLDGHANRLLAQGSDTPLAMVLRDGRLTRGETLSLVETAVIGGWQPLAAMLANALNWLLAHPDDRHEVEHGDQETAAAAVDELLRLEAPIPFTVRVATAEVELFGGTVPAGARVMAVLAAAGRDPAVYAEPDRFRLDRPPMPLPAFGGGPHFCIGAGLVRAVGSLALPPMLRHFGELADWQQAPWRSTLIPRHVGPLPVRLRREVSDAC